jgi:hypothetical protein
LSNLNIKFVLKEFFFKMSLKIVGLRLLTEQESNLDQDLTVVQFRSGLKISSKAQPETDDRQATLHDCLPRLLGDGD